VIDEAADRLAEGFAPRGATTSAASTGGVS